MRWQRPKGKLAAVLLWLSWLLPAAAPAAARDAVAACPTVVQLEGEAALTAQITRRLIDRGLSSPLLPGCPVLRARLEQRGSLLAVTIIEELRRADRVVADLSTAATLIESWARSDISAPLLAAELPLVPPVPEPEVVPRAPVPAPPRPRPRLVVDLLAEATVDIDAQPWLGASLHACALLGPICLGSLLRFAADFPSARSDGLLDQRLAADVLATAELPLHLGRFTIAPGLGLGVRWLRHEVHGRSGSPPPGMTTSPDNDADDYFDVASVSEGGMSAELRFLSSLSLRRGLELAAAVSLGLSFLGDSIVLLPVYNSPSGTSGEPAREPLAGMPWGMLRFDLGLRWSGL